jgi:hypothetical protein
MRRQEGRPERGCNETGGEPDRRKLLVPSSRSRIVLVRPGEGRRRTRGIDRREPRREERTVESDYDHIAADAG